MRHRTDAFLKGKNDPGFLSRPTIHLFVHCLGAVVTLFALGTILQGQNSIQQKEAPPKLIGVRPTATPAGTVIGLDGYRLGAGTVEGLYVTFTQEGRRFDVQGGGSSYSLNDLQEGLQSLAVLVPHELQPGPCQVLVEYHGMRSGPLGIRILPPATPPILRRYTPTWVQPGDTLELWGSGFSKSDEMELTDASGRKRSLKAYDSSEASCEIAVLPEDLPIGMANVRVIEHRSGTNRRSNALRLRIKQGAVPLDIWGDWLVPVAPGQWMDFVVGNSKVISSMERIDVWFQQGQRRFVVAIREVKEWRVQVPPNLMPGTVKIRNRTWVSGEASPWSSSVDYRLLKEPAPPCIYSVEIVPIKAEVATRQQVSDILVSSIDANEYPMVHLPQAYWDGTFVGEVRFWRGGQPSPWVSGFNLSVAHSDGMVRIPELIKQIPIGRETPKTIDVYPSEMLVFRASAVPVLSMNQFEVLLESQGRVISLQASSFVDQRSFKVKLPDAPGEWQVTMHSIGENVYTKMPFAIRIK
jgi:hypothetical protein